jgi:dTMP kinase
MGEIISVEGLDGSGKSTAIEAVNRRLDVHTDAEPSNQAIAEFIGAYDPPSPVDLFAHLLDRSVQQEQVYRPARAIDQWVVLDRYVDSTIAYQRVDLAESPIPPSMIDYLAKTFFDMPAKTILLDVPTHTAIDRTSDTDLHHDRDYLMRVRGQYQRLAEHYDDRFVTVDASQSVEEVCDQVVEIVKDTIDSSGSSDT